MTVNFKSLTNRRVLLLAAAVIAVGAVAAVGTGLVGNATAEGPPPAKAEQAMPVSVATVEARDASIWHEFSGRLEAIDRVDIRPRVAGVVEAVHFREGALVSEGDLLFSIDPAPYAAEVARAEAQVAAAQARVTLAKNDYARAQKLSGTSVLTQRDVDQRESASKEAAANLQGAEAALRTARLNLDYTQVRAPVSGRAGRIEITIGNLVGAGANAPVLTTLVSVNPIYAGFNAGEDVVAAALKTLDQQTDAHLQVGRIPVEMGTAASDGTPYRGKLQLIDNQVDPRSGTIRLRAVFGNANGQLIPGQFVRIRMGSATNRPVLLVDERAIGTDQDKKFVMVVDTSNRATYREVSLGAAVNGLRVVTAGLQKGERIVVNGLQRVRPGALIAPQMVAMDARLVNEPQNRGAVAQQ
jgi:multidrug efflux system membrane fusion protein